MLEEKSEANVFELLAKPVRKTLAELGFTEPTLPQTMAIPTVLSGKNVLLIEPTGSGKKEKQQRRPPPRMPVTTPETLQAILPGSQMRKHLSQVQTVIIDEVHELAGSKRGTQLTIALERLSEVTETPFQRIGLSATIGNPDEVAKFLAGTKREIAVVHAALAKNFR